MPVTALHHFTIRCTPDELPALEDFYTRVIRLTVGARPEIPAPGTWLYADGQPIVHLYAHLSTPDRPVEPVTGHVDHISFRSRGAGGVRVFNTGHGERVVSVAPIAENGDEEA